MLKQLPNLLTTLRLLLAIPICIALLQKNFTLVLVLAFVAGASDGLDGWLARLLNAQSRYGSVVDPLADKLLLTGTYVCLAIVEVIPLWLAVIVLLRDIVIVSGALAYHLLYGTYEMAPTFWGKLSTLVQIVFALLLITQQIWQPFPEFVITSWLWIVVVAALVSCAHYVGLWTYKAIQNHRRLQ